MLYYRSVCGYNGIKRKLFALVHDDSFFHDESLRFIDIDFEHVRAGNSQVVKHNKLKTVVLAQL